MKIAVCMSGQLRQWEIAKENQKWFWETSGVEIDYFIHTWDYSGDREGVSQPYITRDVSRKEFDTLVDWYKPKGCMFDDRKQDFFYANDHWSSLFYSMAHSMMLKRQYENANDFEYDLVIKTRPDVVFDPRYHFTWEPLEDNILFATQGGLMESEFHMFNTNDMVFYGKSYTMDLVIPMYFYRQKMLDQRNLFKDKLFTGSMGPGVLMQEYFRDYGITTQSIQPNRSTFIETLVKLGCPQDLNLMDHNEFHKMEKYFRDWYTK
jgi:hypothetical protein|tara:strand:- start:3991 stop:4779 length:789 start_codon:yes stop_codon:yes gene_type:complete